MNNKTSVLYVNNNKPIEYTAFTKNIFIKTVLAVNQKSKRTIFFFLKCYKTIYIRST